MAKPVGNQRRPDRNERRRAKRLFKNLNLPKPPRTPNRFILYRKYIQNKAKRLFKHLNLPKPPRTPNRFMLYRKHIQNKVFSNPNHSIDMRNLSRIIAEGWKKEPPEVKKYWDKVAEHEKINSSHRSADSLNGLDMTIFSDDSHTFVNTFAPSSTPVASQQNETSIATSRTSFILESPQPDILPSIFSQCLPTPPQSPQPSQSLQSNNSRSSQFLQFSQ